MNSVMITPIVRHTCPEARAIALKRRPRPFSLITQGIEMVSVRSYGAQAEAVHYAYPEAEVPEQEVRGA